MYNEKYTFMYNIIHNNITVMRKKSFIFTNAKIYIIHNIVFVKIKLLLSKYKS